jgi:hypothetical protein
MRPSGAGLIIGMGGEGWGLGEWIRPCGPAHFFVTEIWPATPANLPLIPHPSSRIPSPLSPIPFLWSIEP